MKISFRNLLTTVVAMTLVSLSAQAEHRRTVPNEAALLPQETVDVTHQTLNKLQQYRKSIRAGLYEQGPIGEDIGRRYLRIPEERTETRKSPLAGSPKNPRGHIYGNVTSYNQMYTFNQAFWGEIGLSDGNVTPLYYSTSLINGNDYDLQGGVVVDNIFYTLSLLYDRDTRLTYIYWNRFDIKNGVELTPLYFGRDYGACAYSMTYDPNERIFHLLSFNASDSFVPAYYQVYADDLREGTLILPNYIRDFNTDVFPAAICYCPLDQHVYMFDDNNAVYILDTDTGATIMAGDVLFDTALFPGGIAGQVCYSPLDRNFVAYFRDLDQQKMRILYIDPETWEVYEGVTVGERDSSNITNPFFSAICCLDAFADDAAPEMPATPKVNLMRANTMGSVEFTVPEFDYSGIALNPDVPVHCVLKIDRDVLFEDDLLPGETNEVGFQRSAGVYELTYVCSLNGHDSPVRSLKFCVGHDEPLAPTGLKVEGDVISWQPVTGGVHGGWVDLAAVTYDVFFGDKKLNEEPLKETSFTVTGLDELRMRDISVIATANGQSSQPLAGRAVMGPSLVPPVTLVPEGAQVETFTIVNPTNDDLEFKFTKDTAGKNHFTFTSNAYSTNQNDWLFLPVISFTDTEALYSFSYNYRNAYNYNTLQQYDVVLATAPNPESVLSTLFRHKDVSADMFTNQNVSFVVPEAGDYYLGIHMKTTESSGGLSFADFSVSAVGTTASPADAEVEIVPGAKGALTATFNLTMPTLSISGETLDASDPVKVKIVCVNDPDIPVLEVSALPGEAATGVMEVYDHRSHTFALTPSDKAGEGITRYYSAYIGNDVPLTPQNFRMEVADDDMSVRLLWDAVPEVGANGGYVNPADVTYNVYRLSNGIVYTKLGSTTDLEYTFTPLQTEQLRYNLGVNATSKMGRSSWGNFIGEHLGTPVEVPMIENFNVSGFAYSGVWYYAQLPGGAPTEWENTNSVYGPEYGNPNFNTGGLICYNTGEEATQGIYLFPKVTTRSLSNLCVGIRYWDYPWAPSMEVYMRSASHPDYELIGTLEPTRRNPSKWVNGMVEIPERYSDEGWVQVSLRVNLDAPFSNGMTQAQFGIFDTFSLVSNIDYDLKLNYVSGPQEAVIGGSAEYLVSVINSGAEPLDGHLTVSLLDENGNSLAAYSEKVNRLASGRVFEKYFDFNIIKEYATNKALTLRAEVTSDKDELAINNVREVLLNLYDSPMPSVADLKARWNDERNVALLEWSEPDLYYGSRDDVELYPAWSKDEQLGEWRNLDRDGGQLFGIEGVNMPEPNAPSAWMVFNANEAGTMNDDRLCPHSGEQFLMARSLYYNEEDYSDEELVQASDWLISPEIVGGSEISFWYGTISVAYKEYVELWYSTTDNNPESFVKLRSFSKEGSESWEKVTYTLPADARYFALVYCSYNSFAAMLDDIDITPVRLNKWVVDHYSVWRYDNNDWATFHNVAEKVDALNYADTNPTDVARYFVVTHVKHGDKMYKGPKSNGALLLSAGIDDITDLGGIYGGKGEIRVVGHAGEQLALYTADGRISRLVKITGDNETIPTDAGVYIAKIGNAHATVIIK